MTIHFKEKYYHRTNHLLDLIDKKVEDAKQPLKGRYVFLRKAGAYIKTGVCVLALSVATFAVLVFDSFSRMYISCSKSLKTRSQIRSDIKGVKNQKEIINRFEELDNKNELFKNASKKKKEIYNKKALSIYASSKKHYAPVVIKWTQALLEDAINNNKSKEKPKRLVFLARDGIAPYEVAKVFKEKFPDRYGNIPISLLYFSRKVVDSQENLIEYAKQEGLQKEEECVFVDIGFSGSMIPKIKELFEPLQIRAEFNFLISRTKDAHGFVSGLQEDGQLDEFKSIRHCAKISKALLWLEDTHQGVQESPSCIVKHSDGKYYPDTLVPGQEAKRVIKQPKNYLYRYAGRQSIIDAAVEFEIDTSYIDKTNGIRAKLDKKTKHNFDLFLQRYNKGRRVLFIKKETPDVLKYQNQNYIKKQKDSDYISTSCEVKKSQFDHLCKTPIDSNLLEAGCENFFDKRIFSNYYFQLKKNWKIQRDEIDCLIDSKFKTNLENLHHFFENEALGDSAEIHQHSYQEMIKNLRGVIDHLKNVNEFDPVLAGIKKKTQEFVQSFFLTINLYPTGLHWFKEKMNIDGFNSKNNISDLVPFLFSLQNQFKQANGKKNKILLDPFLTGNLPYKNYEIRTQKGKNIPILRMANVASDREKISSQLIYPPVAEEFDFFVDGYCKLKKTHLYVQLMHLTGSSNEATRSESISQFQKKYSNTLQLLALDRNSDFYFQRKEGKNLASDFKKEFLLHSLDSKYYRWPKPLDGNSWEKEFNEVVNHIHKYWFDDKKTLNREDRRIFIELVYCEIINKAITVLDVDSANFSCKNCIDRGGITQVLFYAYNTMRFTKQIPDQFFQDIVFMTFLPPMLVSGRPMARAYFDNLSLTLSYILKKSQSFNDNPPPKNEITSIEMYRSFTQDSLKYDDTKENIQDNNLLNLLLKPDDTPKPTSKIDQLIDNQVSCAIKGLSDQEKVKLISFFREKIEEKKLFENKDDLKKIKYIKRAIYTYKSSKDNYGPVLIKWVESLFARALQSTDEPKRLIFLARDGLAPFEVAKILQKKKPVYAKVPLSVMYVSRKIAKDEQSSKMLSDYALQEGLKKKEKCIFVDIGFAGSIKPVIEEKLKKLKITSEFCFLISRNKQIHGFLSDYSDCSNNNNHSEFKSVGISAGGNPAVYWMEDCHQNVYDSPENLVKIKDRYYPSTLIPNNTKDCSKSFPKIYLYKTAGFKAVIDAAQEYDSAEISDIDLNASEWKKIDPKLKKKFDDFLITIKSKNHLHDLKDDSKIHFIKHI